MHGDARDAERTLALSYAPPASRDALEALLALDAALATLLRTTREPALGQLRLAWWREALAQLDTAPAPAEPVLQAIQRTLVNKGVSGASLVPIVHGWEVLIEEEALTDDALQRFAAGRARLFTAAGDAMAAGQRDPLEIAGQGWALVDLAANLQAPDEAAEARALAAPLLDRAAAARWSRNGRALGALAHLARLDLRRPGPAGAPHRVGRMLWHRLTGR